MLRLEDLDQMAWISGDTIAGENDHLFACYHT